MNITQAMTFSFKSIPGYFEVNLPENKISELEFDLAEFLLQKGFTFKSDTTGLITTKDSLGLLKLHTFYFYETSEITVVDKKAQIKL